MKTWHLYFTDNPFDYATCDAVDYFEAEQLANQYIREWHLDAVIDHIEEVKN